MKLFEKILMPYHRLNVCLARNKHWFRFRTELKELAKANIVKTIYFNFKIFPFHIARKLPVWFYGKVRFYYLGGEIRFERPIHSRVVVIGKNSDYFGSRYISTIGIQRGGIWILKGDFLGSEGVLIDIKGKLITGHLTALGTASKIRCHQYVEIGDGVDITEECQVFDTNFHFTQNIHTGEVKRMTDKIVLGDFTWIGNRTTVAKGTVLPPYTLVCSNSLVNKDFSNVETNCPLLGGIPARLIGGRLHRIYDKDLEQRLWQQFGADPSLKSVIHPIVESDVGEDLRKRGRSL